MKILILGLNYAPEQVGIAVYSSGMAEALAEKGHEVRFVAGRPYYPEWRVMDGHNAWTYKTVRQNGVTVTYVPHYIPAKPTGVKRLIHHATFLMTSLPVMLWRALTFRPDVVFTVAPSLIAAPNAWLAAKLCGAKTWLHIQDFEAEAAVATGLLPKGGRAARLALRFEARVFKLFDTVSAISPQMCRKLTEKGIATERVVEFRNWADVDAIKPLKRPSVYREEWNITTPHVALYSGNIANKQGIEIVVESARQLAHREDLTFVVCGDGPNRKKLEALASGLTNIRFYGLQPRERLNDLMGLATVHLLPQKADAAELVLPSKLTNMLASGRPVVATAIEGTSLYSEVEGCGIVTGPENATAFAGAIERLINDPINSNKLALAARFRAEDRWRSLIILNQVGAGIETLAFAETKNSVAKKARQIVRK